MAYNPKFQINLKQVFNRAYASAPSKLRDELRSTLSNPTFRATFGKLVMDKIIERTLSGIDKDGVEFKAYSKSYINSDIFKIYSKSPGDVNLKLTGEMLASLTTKGNGPILSVELIGDENKAKAHGHKYGIKTKGGGRVKRDFLGLPENELEELMKSSVELTRNDAYTSAAEFFENTTLADSFGQVGDQAELPVSILTTEVLTLLAQGLL